VLPVIQLVGGLALLVFGAEWLIRGASRLALALGVPSLIIGLTVVAFGTSAPELAVSVKASLTGNGGIALGNVFGSNIANVLLILGLSASITPLAVSAQLIRVDVPIMVLSSLMVLGFAWDLRFSRLEGVLLLLSLAAYLMLQYAIGRNFSEGLEDLQESEDLVETKPQPMPLWRACVILILGLGLLVLGANGIVLGAVSIAEAAGISQEIIALTIVAVGTSLPEIVTSILAAIRKEPEIALGNVVGSNIFNIFGVLGVSSAIAPEAIGIPATMFRHDIPIMVVVAAICVPFFITGSVVSRREGLLMFLGYLAYLGFQLYQTAEARS